MQQLTVEGRAMLEDVAGRHGVSVEAVMALLGALIAGQGSQAQFTIAELGGMGQWSRGGMTMVGDMFNTALKARVDALCSELAGLVGDAQLHAPAQSLDRGGDTSLFLSGSGETGAWWPSGLGHAASSGAQNDLRYAVFPETRRLAIDLRGRVTVYDTGDHRIGGVSQQQSGDQSLSFTSQHGLVRVADLPMVQAEGRDARDQPSERAPQRPRPAPSADEGSRGDPAREDDVFGKLERLADLHGKGVLSDDEFGAKKAELLARL